MTYIAYFVLFTSVAFLVFCFSGAKNKSRKDFIIATIILFANTIASLALSIAYLEMTW